MPSVAVLRTAQPASFPREPTSLLRPYSTASASHRSFPVAPLRSRASPFRRSPVPTHRGVGPAALPAVPHYYGGPDFSLRVGPAFRTRPYRWAYPSGSSAPDWRHEHPRRGRNETSPGQALLCPSVPSAHTLSRSARRRYFLRPKAAGSDPRTHGRPVRLALASATARRFDAGPSDSTSRWTPCPPPVLRHEAAGSCSGFLSTQPPCEGAAGLSPARETPCWAHSPNPKYLNRQGAKCARIHEARNPDMLTDATTPWGTPETWPLASVAGGFGGSVVSWR